MPSKVIICLLVIVSSLFSISCRTEAKGLTGKYTNKAGNTISITEGGGTISFSYEGSFETPGGAPHICDCTKTAKAAGAGKYQFRDEYNPQAICSIEIAGGKLSLKEIKGGAGNFCGCCGAGWRPEEFPLKGAK
jgi:hypothetical protein